MARSGPVGILIGTGTTGDRIGPIAARAEEVGFDEVWVAEEYVGYGGFSAAAIALAATRQSTVGLGIINTVSRPPAVTAMEIATLARAFPGRFLPVIGHGAPWKIGLTVRSPLTELDGAIRTVRGLLGGETIAGVTLPHPVDPALALLAGVMRPKSLELSGRVADGTLISVLGGPRYLEQSWGPIQAGMVEGGRTEHRMPVYVLCHVDPDRAAARTSLRPLIAYYLARIGPSNPLSAAYGYADAIADMVARGGVETVEREMPDSWIDALAVAGNPDDVIAGFQRFREAGATSIIAVPLQNRTEQQMEALAASVLPRLP
ncbi:MAG TPA: LLM class flavin-dependent oxidoreductase [Pseudolysinimonas sp.]